MNEPNKTSSVVFNPAILVKKSVVMDKDGNLIEVKTPQEKKRILAELRRKQ
jgi:hypothetical protein